MFLSVSNLTKSYNNGIITHVLSTSGFGIGIVLSADIEAFPEATSESVTVYGVRFHDRENINAQTSKLHVLQRKN
ncbi:MAG: hypothetical protein AB7V48_16630 [Sedimentibacter sp.]